MSQESTANVEYMKDFKTYLVILKITGKPIKESLDMHGNNKEESCMWI